MKNSLIAVAALIATFASMSVSASAADTTTVAADTSTRIVVCRNAKSGETPTATTAANVALVCKPLDMKPIMAIKSAVMAMPDGAINWQKLLSDMDFQDRNR